MHLSNLNPKVRLTLAHDSIITTLATDGTLIVRCSYNDDVVKVWNMDLELLQSEEQAGDIWCVAISPDSTTIASGDEEGEVKLWKRGAERRFKCTKTVEDHARRERSVFGSIQYTFSFPWIFGGEAVGSCTLINLQGLPQVRSLHLNEQRQ